MIRKTIKWHKKLFWWLIEIALHNAHVCYNDNRVAAGLNTMSHLDFQLEVINNLCHHPDPRDIAEDDLEEEMGEVSEDEMGEVSEDEMGELSEDDESIEMSSETNRLEDEAWNRLAQNYGVVDDQGEDPDDDHEDGHGDSDEVGHGDGDEVGEDEGIPVQCFIQKI